MFGSVFKLLEDTVKIAVAPVDIGAALLRTVTKPVAEVAEEIAEELDPDKQN